MALIAAARLHIVDCLWFLQKKSVVYAAGAQLDPNKSQTNVTAFDFLEIEVDTE